MNKHIAHKIISKINDIPIRQKFILIYMGFILLPMLLVYTIFFIQLRDEVALRESNVIDQSINRVESDVRYLIGSCFSIARDIAVDQEINEMIDKEYDSSVDYFEVYYEKLRDQIQMYATSYNNVIRVSIYAKNDTVLSGGNIYTISTNVENSPWFQITKDIGFQESIVTWIEKDSILDSQSYNRISIIRKMDEFAQFDKDKFVRIDIAESRFNNILQETYNIDFVITDFNNRIVASSIPRKGIDASIDTNFDASIYTNKNSLVTRIIEPTENLKWKIIAIVPKQNLSDEINNYAGLVAMMLGGSLIFSVLFIIIFSGSYNARIQTLQKHMKKVENSEFITIEGDQGKDEIGGLIRAFNQMTRRINGLVNEVFKFSLKEKEHQLEQVKAELKFLQSQMDPHFLFNTLNAILVVSSRYGYTEITNIIKYLSKTLRYLIEWDDSMVPLEKELTFTKMYLEIEKFRFRDKFDFDIFIEDTLDQVLVPKLSIQPFVENACKHGLQATKSSGKLDIRIYEMDGYINIVVEDNGIGMTPECLTSVLEHQADSHIGINNVLKRLQIHYTDTYDFQITSVYGSGTKVMIKIPSQVQNKED